MVGLECLARKVGFEIGTKVQDVCPCIIKMTDEGALGSWLLNRE